MCGLAVAIDWEGAETIVGQLIGGLAHRGDVTDPIATPFPNTAMGTRRLRIVDGAHAIQPQLSHDNRILVSFTGEIYNHRDLLREMEALGVVFKTTSDTEVLACALSLWGPSILDRLNGMYAFVAVDLRSGQFIAARDPFGTKPLYLIQSETGFLFCSEIRPLLAAVPTGEVLLLPPGYRLGRTTCVRFKTFQTDPARPQTTHDPRTLDRLLEAAVHSRVPPDLPFAVMFSGGIDSTLVAHYARRIAPGAPGYFLGGPEAPDYAYAAHYADATGFDLRFADIGADCVPALDLITDVVETLESFEPETVRNGLCTYRLSKRIHDDGFRVALCGEGADELFAGYFPLELAFADGNAAGRFVRDQHLVSMHRNGLQRIDRCGMRFQVEIREPFLDPAIATYALGLDGSDLVETAGGKYRGKAPLRSLYDLHPENLPACIRDRQKVAFNEGSGFDRSRRDSPWVAFAEDHISEADLSDGRKRFAAFDIRSKEELLYLDRLAASMDVFRVPHLVDRTRLTFPAVKGLDILRPYFIEA